MSGRPEQLSVNGVSLVADISGALLWPERRLAAVADLHFEKGSAFAERGQFLPPYDTAVTLDKLEALLARHDVKRLICLGDSFHDQGAAARLPDQITVRLQGLIARYDWIWIAGNHDPAPPQNLGGSIAAEWTEGALTFRHEAEPQAMAGEVSGHFHPKAAVRVRNKRITAPCFVTDGRKLILPAFGAFTGGLNVLDPAIAGLLGRSFQVMLLGRKQVFAFPRKALCK
ncbi:ligase-associated DNA damage response endonuclease PdeM [Pelagibius litoralis]|uniref:Ligase-associated DNA damage response endonuclease PdeM n=1 Tax=Pelagibius litoralis TaxID=374515 RepID=A0A967CC74_9PROT|nr:ligase-associated DNA damage response endonuclease PdeM [Pelagibius litoralis]NIA68878.1 ligase-associated DNA damage response endonuclease PdeM [Pelagibius litoralis]